MKTFHLLFDIHYREEKHDLHCNKLVELNVPPHGDPLRVAQEKYRQVCDQMRYVGADDPMIAFSNPRVLTIAHVQEIPDE